MSNIEFISDFSDTKTEKYKYLFEAATKTLHEEDQLLFSQMSESKYYNNVGNGLTYWLYETTLVYIIFRSWLPLHNVAWEHNLGNIANRQSPFGQKRKETTQLCDLMLLDKDGNESVAIEAK